MLSTFSTLALLGANPAYAQSYNGCVANGRPIPTIYNNSISDGAIATS